MVARRWLFAFWLLLSLQACRQVEAGNTTIVLSPLEYVAYEGHSNATFSCTVYTTGTSTLSVVWYVDKQTYSSTHAARGITDTDATMVDELTLQGTLTIDALKVNSNTTIHCIGLFNDVFPPSGVRSEDAAFLVQGTPDKCENPRMLSNGSFHQKLQWDSPFTLDITDVHPDIYGYRICSNLSSTCTYIDVQEHGSDSLSLRQFVLPNLQTTVELNISAVNIVGEGNHAAVITQPCIQHTEPVMLPESQFTAEVNVSPSEPPRTTVRFQISGSCFDIYLVTVETEVDGGSGSYQDRLETISSGIAVVVDLQLVPQVSEDGTVTLTINSGLSENHHYGVSIESLQDQTLIGSFSFHTYDVQEATVTEVTDTQITIECTFASGSEAQGCAIRFNTSITVPGDFDKILRVLGDSPNSFPPTAKGTISAPARPYTVLVYDLEMNGSISSSSALTLSVEAPQVEPSPTVTSYTPPAVGNNQESSDEQPPLTVVIAALCVGTVALLTIVILVIIAAISLRRKRGLMKVRSQKTNSRSSCWSSEEADGKDNYGEKFTVKTTEHIYAVLEGPTPIEPMEDCLVHSTDTPPSSTCDGPDVSTEVRAVPSDVATELSPQHEMHSEQQANFYDAEPQYETIGATRRPRRVCSERTGHSKGRATLQERRSWTEVRPSGASGQRSVKGINLTLADETQVYDEPVPRISPTSPVLPTPTSITPLINQDSVPEDEPLGAGQRPIRHSVSPTLLPPAPPIPEQMLPNEELARLDMLPPHLPPVTIKSQRVPIYDNDHEALEPFVQAAAERAFHLPTVPDHYCVPQGDYINMDVEMGVSSTPAQEHGREQNDTDDSEGEWYENVSSSTTAGNSPSEEVSQQAARLIPLAYKSDGDSPACGLQLVDPTC